MNDTHLTPYQQETIDRMNATLATIFADLPKGLQAELSDSLDEIFYLAPDGEAA